MSLAPKNDPRNSKNEETRLKCPGIFIIMLTNGDICSAPGMGIPVGVRAAASIPDGVGIEGRNDSAPWGLKKFVAAEMSLGLLNWV